MMGLESCSKKIEVALTQSTAWPPAGDRVANGVNLCLTCAVRGTFNRAHPPGASSAMKKRLVNAFSYQKLKFLIITQATLLLKACDILDRHSHFCNSQGACLLCGVFSSFCSVCVAP